MPENQSVKNNRSPIQFQTGYQPHSLKPDNLAPVIHDELSLVDLFQDFQTEPPRAGKDHLGLLLRSEVEGTIRTTGSCRTTLSTDVVHRTVIARQRRSFKKCIRGAFDDIAHRLRHPSLQPLFGAQLQMTLASSVYGFLSTKISTQTARHVNADPPTTNTARR